MTINAVARWQKPSRLGSLFDKCTILLFICRPIDDGRNHSTKLLNFISQFLHVVRQGGQGLVAFVLELRSVWEDVCGRLVAKIRRHWDSHEDDDDDNDEFADESSLTATCREGDEDETCSLQDAPDPSQVSSSPSSASDVPIDDPQQQDWATAAQYYRQAVKKQTHHPRANFNLGYMYQWGLGVPQDFPLAKRHYDSAAATSHEAQVPVAIALWSLQWHQYILIQYEHLKVKWQKYRLEQQERAKVAASSNGEGRNGDTTADAPSRGRMPKRTTKDILIDHLLSWESALLLLLTLILSYLLNIRRTRR